MWSSTHICLIIHWVTNLYAVTATKYLVGTLAFLPGGVGGLGVARGGVVGGEVLGGDGVAGAQDAGSGAYMDRI